MTSKTGSAGSVTGLSDSAGERRHHAGGAIESPHSSSVQLFARSGGASTFWTCRAVRLGAGWAALVPPSERETKTDTARSAAPGITVLRRGCRFPTAQISKARAKRHTNPLIRG